jgi:PBSX family phage terminase large subunit
MQSTGAGHDYMILGYSQGSIERNVLKPIAELFAVDTKQDKNNAFEFCGNRVVCFGCDDAEAYKSMQGFTAFGALINEAVLLHPSSVRECFARCSGIGSRIFMDTNPDHPLHYIKTDYIDKDGELLISGKPWVRSFGFKIEDNHTLTQDYIESLKRASGKGVFYDRKILGLWVSAEGAIYPELSLEANTCEPFDIPSDWQRYRGIDLGYNNPFVCLWGAVDHDDTLYIYDEHYEAKQLIKYHAEKIRERKGRFVSTARDHDAQEGAELEDLGIYTTPARKDVEAGIQAVAKRIAKNDKGKPRLIIFKNCTNTIRELFAYCWSKTKPDKETKEQPNKINDHTCDALRYMVMDIDNGGIQIF